jgi:hypothetical protein
MENVDKMDEKHVDEIDKTYESEQMIIICKNDNSNDKIKVKWLNASITFNETMCCKISDNMFYNGNFDEILSNVIVLYFKFKVNELQENVYLHDQILNDFIDSAYEITSYIYQKFASYEIKSDYVNDKAKFADYANRSLRIILPTQKLFGELFYCKLQNRNIRQGILHNVLLSFLNKIENANDGFVYLKANLVNTELKILNNYTILDYVVVNENDYKVVGLESLDPKRIYENLFIKDNMLRICRLLSDNSFNFTQEEIDVINRLHKQCGNVIMKNYKIIRRRFWVKFILGVLVLASVITGFVKSGVDNYFIPLIVFASAGFIIAMLIGINDYYTEFIKLDESKHNNFVTKIPESCECFGENCEYFNKCTDCCLCCCYRRKKNKLYWIVNSLCSNRDVAYGISLINVEFEDNTPIHVIMDNAFGS